MNEQGQERLLLLYLKTGGGHIASARAFANFCESKYSSHDLRVFVLDAAPAKSRFLKFMFEDFYRFSSLRFPLIWYIFYYSNYFNLPAMKFSQRLFCYFAGRYLREIILSEGITRIVSFHFLLTDVIERAQKRAGVDIPVATVVTDPFTCHPIWFSRAHYPFIVYSSRMKRFAQRVNPRAQLVQFPPIINTQFETAIPAEKIPVLRRKYGFSTHKKLVLITGGGDGMQKARHFVRAIVSANLNIDLAIVCGRNEEQYSMLKAEVQDRANVRIFGFVDFMYDLMNIADIIIAKAGPATIYETLLLRKTLIVTQKIHGQECGNVHFIQSQGLGYYITRADKIVEKLAILLNTPAETNSYTTNIEGLNIEIGSEKILDYILNLKTIDR